MYINITIFIISFIIGLVFIYLSPIEYKTVLLEPTYDNIDKYQYVDSNDQCYKLVARLVDCKSASHITKFIKS
jgi:hypothetical protein